MMYSSNILLVLFILCFGVSFCASLSCTPTLSTGVNSYTYDLTPLTTTLLTSNSNYLQMCGEVRGNQQLQYSTTCAPGTMICYENSPSSSVAYVDGRVADPVWSFIPGAMPSYGVQLTAYGRLNSQSGSNCDSVQTVIQILCRSDYIQPASISSSPSYYYCSQSRQNTFTIYHASGCPVSNNAETLTSDLDHAEGKGIGIGVAIGVSVPILLALAVVFIFYRRQIIQMVSQPREKQERGFVKLEDGSMAAPLQPLAHQPGGSMSV